MPRRKATRLEDDSLNIQDIIWREKGKLALSLLRTRQNMTDAMDQCLATSIQAGSPMAFAQFDTPGGRKGMIAIVFGEEETVKAWDALSQVEGFIELKPEDLTQENKDGPTES